MKEVIVPADDLVCLGKEKLQEVIRCKDCRYCTEKKGTAINKHCTWWYRTVDDEDYCSRAERKEE